MKTTYSRRPRLWAALAACLGAALWPGLLAAAPAPVRTLILSGQNNHDWRQTTPKLKALLTASGRFAVDVTERPDQCNAATFARYDLIVSDWNNWGGAKIKEWPAQTREDFLNFVRNGGGHVVVHAGSAGFFEWAEYQKMVGGTWGKDTGHGAIHSFEVKPLEPDHPITRGLKPFKTTDELWHRTATQPDIKVLATAFSAKDKGGSGQDEPVAFVTQFGKGRNFNLVLGHDVAAMASAGFQALLVRGAEWAATGKVTLGGWSAEAAEAALGALKTYRFGDNRAPLLAVEELVQASAGDLAARAKLTSELSGLLATGATLEARQFACRQLALIGGTAEVPVLARLLPDKDLSYFARLALERIPGEESFAALQAGLGTTTGRLRVGVIDSLAVRRSEKAVPALLGLLADPDVETVGAALEALGRIGSAGAASALLSVDTGAAGVKARLGAAMLRCAEARLAAGQAQEAAPLLAKLMDPGQPPYLRLAAFPLHVSSLGEKGADLVLAALAGEDKALQAAAIRALRTTRSTPLIQAAAGRLDRLGPDLQVQVIALLGERGEAAALPAVTAAASSKEPTVRRAAVTALGSLGTAATVPVLASAFESTDADDRRVATDALTRLRAADVEAAMVAELKKSGPATQRGIIRVLAARGARTVTPALIEIVSSPDAAVRREAVVALEKTGDLSACAPLIRLLDPAGDAGPIESALAAICRREGSVEPIVSALGTSAAAKQALLLGVLGSVGSPRALEAVRAASKADDIETRAAAVRALADWPDAGPLDDLAALAATTTEARLKTLALRGVAKLAPQAKNRPTDQVVDLVCRAMSGAEVNEQKALLGALGELPSLPALQAASTQLKTPSLADEAGMAVLKIVEAIGEDHRAEAKGALGQVTALCKNAAITDRAAAMTLKFGELRNLSRGATATSPDGLDKDGAAGGDEAAIDGNPATYWDEVDNQKLYILCVQLKQRSTVVFLKILGWQQHNYAPKDFEVLCDGKVIKKIEGAPYKNNWLTVDLPVTDCTTVELRITGYYGQSPAIRELEIWGKPVDAPAPQGAARPTRIWFISGEGNDTLNSTPFFTAPNRPSPEADPALRWTKSDANLALLKDGRVLWQHQHDRQQGKPFFHPIALPDGTELTALRPADHPWHRALWFSWKFIDGLNYWEEDAKTGQSEGQTEVLAVQSTADQDGSARLELQMGYHPPQGALVLKETRLISLTAPDAQGGFRMDWTSTFEATTKDVKLERTPIPDQPGGVGYGGYAGWSLRLSAATKAWAFRNSGGAVGERETHGKAARWLDFCGKTSGGAAAGVAVFDHPSNLRHPTPWYVSQGMPYFSPALLFNESYTLTKDKPLTLRYRFLLHMGLLSKEALEKEWESYRATPTGSKSKLLQ
jgi:type 1 glutamine amidotransferase/HEAT repeat protein